MLLCSYNPAQDDSLLSILNFAIHGAGSLEQTVQNISNAMTQR